MNLMQNVAAAYVVRSDVWAEVGASVSRATHACAHMYTEPSFPCPHTPGTSDTNWPLRTGGHSQTAAKTTRTCMHMHATCTCMT